MRSTLRLLHEIKASTPVVPRLRERIRAKDLIARAQQASAQQGNVFFQQLPTPLAEFFQKYPPAPFRKYATESTSTEADDANPFLYNRNPVTKRVHDPVYSLRRQSDLYKAAYRYGIAHLLPPLVNGKKFYEDKYENKKPIRGSQKFKLTKSERNREDRQKEMDEAIANADELILKARGSKYRKRLEAKQKKGLPWF